MADYFRGPWTSENDPVSFFVRYDASPFPHGEGSTGQAIEKVGSFASIAESAYGVPSFSLADLVTTAARRRENGLRSLLKSLITVTEAAPDPLAGHGSGGRLTYADLEGFKTRIVRAVGDGSASGQLASHTEYVVARDPEEDGGVRVVSYTVTPLVNVLGARSHVCTPLGFVMERSAERRHSLRLLSSVLEAAGLPRIKVLPMPLKLDGADYIPMGPSLALFGTGEGTYEATVRYLLDDDALGAETVAVVRNLFDRGGDRGALESVVKFVGGRCVAVAQRILGKSNPLRRLVIEYTRADGPRADAGGPLAARELRTAVEVRADDPPASAGAAVGATLLGEAPSLSDVAQPARSPFLGRLADPGIDGDITEPVADARAGKHHYLAVDSTTTTTSDGICDGDDDGDDGSSDESSSGGGADARHAYAVTRYDVELGEYLESSGLHVIPIPDDVFDETGMSVVNFGRGRLLVANDALAEVFRRDPVFDGEVAVATEDIVPNGEDPRRCFSVLRAHMLVMRRPATETAAQFAAPAPAPASAPARDDTGRGAGAAISTARLPTRPREGEMPLAGPASIGSIFVPETRPGTHDPPRQSTGTVLMVAPVGFARNEETALDNAYMHTMDLPAAEIERRALAEFSLAHAALTSRGVKVMLFSSEKFHRTPDACFPNNWMSTHPPRELGASTLVTYPMATVSRRAERRENIVSALQSMYDREISFVQWEAADFPHFLESTGVLILDRVNRVAYATLSQRCYRRISETWAKRLGYDLFLMTMTDEHGRPCYHTNVMMSIGTSFAVVCFEAIVDPALRADLRVRLEGSGRAAVVDITRAQVAQFCGNVLEIRDGKDRPILVMSSSAHAAFTKEQLEVLSQTVHEIVHVSVPTIEHIGGGGIRCMLGEIF